MVQITLKFGASKYSSFGFVTYGTCLVSARSDNAGYRFGQTGLHLLKRFRSKELSAWARGTYYGNIAPYYESIHNSLEQLLKASGVGFRKYDMSEMYALYLWRNNVILVFSRNWLT